MRPLPLLAICWLLSLLAAPGPDAATATPVEPDAALARAWFQEAEALSRRDGGRLWGAAHE